jgi:WhiB family transcriptional regulator, redox-sensing transcriptional regulator
MTDQMDRLLDIGSPAPERARHLSVADMLDEVVALDTSWMPKAACTGRVDLFFGIAGERPERRVRREAEARQVCAGCPVIEPCRQAARLNRESGFWGGENEEERAAAGFAPRSVSRRSVQAASSAARRAASTGDELPPHAEAS